MKDQMHPFLVQAVEDPAWLFYQFDLPAGTAGFVQITEDIYRAAPFLDQRLPVHRPRRVAVGLGDLMSAREAHLPAPRRGHFIFHLGHCGSTLLSRLLGELDGVLALREPLPLGLLSMLYRDHGTSLAWLNDEDYRRLQQTVYSLLKRRFRHDQTPVIKATSICVNLLPAVLGDHPDTRVVMMYVDLETYLATMLRNRVRREEINANAQTRLRDLLAHLGGARLRLYELDQVQRTVVSWLAGMQGFQDAASAQGERALWVDFAGFLEDPRAGVARAAAHCGLGADTRRIEAAVNGPIMKSYAKDPASPYSAADRRAEMVQSRRDNGAAIRAGMKWAERLMRQHQALRSLGASL